MESGVGTCCSNVTSPPPVSHAGRADVPRRIAEINGSNHRRFKQKNKTKKKKRETITNQILLLAAAAAVTSWKKKIKRWRKLKRTKINPYAVLTVRLYERRRRSV